MTLGLAERDWRLGKIADGSLEMTNTDLLFYQHELVESTLTRMGLKFDDAHEITWKRIQNLKHTDELYHGDLLDDYYKQLADEYK